jgi:hypothetical protein
MRLVELIGTGEIRMVTLNDQERQVVDIIGTLPADRRRLVLYELAKDSRKAWQQNAAYAEDQLRRLAGERGENWDQMDDEQRQRFVDDLLHEDSSCNCSNARNPRGRSDPQVYSGTLIVPSRDVPYC